MTLDGFTGSAGVALDTAINRAIPGEYHPTINARFVQTVEDYTKGNTSQDQLSALRDELLDQAADQRSQAARVLELCELSRRRSLLALLARRAELLAARERELRDAIVVVALKAIGAATDKLDKSIREAEAQFEDSQSGEATVAHAARQKLADGKVIAHAGEVAGELTRNLLARHLDQPGKLGSVASTLDEVAVILCRRPVFGEMKVIAKESERHIRRQTETNANITAKIRNQERAPSRTELFSKQEQLRREVPEGASALHCLARQLIGFESATADKLDAAAKEMDMGLSDLDRAACPKALEHGERTLGLLRDAREHFDAKMIQRHLGRYRQLARRVGVAATQMAVSRISLSAGDTGPQTRRVQSSTILLLESLIQEAYGSADRVTVYRVKRLAEAKERPSTGQAGRAVPLPDGAKGRGWRRARQEPPHPTELGARRAMDELRKGKRTKPRPRPQRDLAIVSIEAPALVRLGDEVHLSVQITSPGLRPSRIPVRLTRPSRRGAPAAEKRENAALWSHAAEPPLVSQRRLACRGRVHTW